MSSQAGGYVAMDNRLKEALLDGAIRPLAAVHLKLADIADRLPVEDRHRLQPLTSILAQFEDELRRLAGMPAPD